MKRKIVLGLILLLEFFVLFVFGFYSSIGSPELLKPIYDFGKLFFDHVIVWFRDLCHLNVNHGSLIACVLLNVALIIIYALVAWIVKVIVYKSRMKKIRKVVTIPYKLNEQEKELLEPERFKKRVPWWLVVSLIIPAVIITIGLLARFDEAFSKEIHANVLGTSHFYTDFIVKYFHSGTLHTFIRRVFHNGPGIGYMDIINKIPESLAWLEYVIIALGTVIVLAIWFFLFYLLYMPFRGLVAKSKSKRATKKYIYKQEVKEYKYRSKHTSEYSSKSEEFMHLVEDEDEEKQNIAKNTKKSKKIKENERPSDYYDDLGSSVRDLGVGTSEEVAMDKPFIEREVRYVSDSDFDIVLENEPVIEVAEEEGIDSLSEQTKEDELFYEKYQPEDVQIKPFEEYDQGRTVVSDYVEKMNQEPQPSDDQEKPVVIIAEEYDEEASGIEVVENDEEESNLSPLERYRLEKKKATEERNLLLEQGKLTEENDPLAKYRKPGVRAGKVEAKVPTMAELEEERKAIHDERSRRIKEGLEKKRNAQLAAARLKAKNSKHGGETKIAPKSVHETKIKGEKKVPSTKTTKKPTRVVPGERKVPPHKVK